MRQSLNQRWQFSWQLVRYLWRNPKLLLLPIVHKLVYLALISWFALPLVESIALHNHNFYFTLAKKYHIDPAHWHFYVLLLVLFSITNLVGSVSFAAIDLCVLQHLRGDRASLKTAIKTALKRSWRIYQWCLYRSVVGGFCRLFMFTLRWFSVVKRWLIAYSWNITTIFSLILIADSKTNAWHAVGNSAKLLRKTWAGEHIRLRIPLGLSVVFLLLVIAALIPAFIGWQHHTPAALSIGIGISWALMSILFIIEECLAHIMIAVIYAYSQDGIIQAPFTHEIVSDAFREVHLDE